MDIGNSNYNSAVAIARYQTHHGIYFEGSYTIGKSIDDGSSFFGSTGERAGLEDRNKLAADRGPSSFDIRHRAVFTYVVDLPVGPGHNSNPDAAFDKTYFSNLTTSPHPGRLGTSGRNQYYGPGLQNWNFSTTKLFPLGTERLHLRFEADFFKLFNHTNFSNPVGSQSSGNFGKITSTLGSGTATAVGTTAGGGGGGPRIIQGSLRLVF